MDFPTSPDIFELRAIAKHIETHPEEWRQAYWATRVPRVSCGTALCFAGHAVARAGCTFIFGEHDAITYVCKTPEGREREIGSLARELLGLTREQAESLFAANNSLQTIKDVIDRIEETTLSPDL